MKKITVMFLLVSFVFIQNINAYEKQGAKKLADRLLVLMKVDIVVGETLEMIQKIHIDELMQIKAQVNAPEEKAKKLIDQMLKAFEKELKWESMKDEMAQVYVDTFTVDELKQLIRFYQSDVGKKVVGQTPLIMKKTSEIAQKHRIKLAPIIKRISGDMLGIEMK